MFVKNTNLNGKNIDDYNSRKLSFSYKKSIYQYTYNIYIYIYIYIGGAVRLTINAIKTSYLLQL